MVIDWTMSYSLGVPFLKQTREGHMNFGKR